MKKYKLSWRDKSGKQIHALFNTYFQAWKYKRRIKTYRYNYQEKISRIQKGRQ